MYLNEDLRELLCAKSKSNPHFVEKPISLQCGHCCCKNCLPKEHDHGIECYNCGLINYRDLRYDNESIATKKLLRLYLSNLYIETEKETSKNMEKLKS